MASVPPRPSVVTSLVSVETPWKPATSTILPASSASSTRCARISRIFARPCASSVTMPAWLPVSETASRPRSWIAIATSAQEMRSPVESSMSSSRPSGWGETSWASAISESVVLPMAETVPTTRSPLRFASTRRCATPRTLAASATDDPPNFITTVSNAMSPCEGTAGSVPVIAATQAVSQVLARKVSAGELAGVRLAEHVPVVDHVGVPEHPSDGALARSRR